MSETVPLGRSAPSAPNWWERLKRWFAGPPRHHPVRYYTPEEPETEFTSPAAGDAYHFPVRVHWSFSGTFGSDRALAASIEPVLEEVWERIVVTTRCVLRAYPPCQPADAEHALNKQLTELARASATSSGGGARWTARVEVGLPDAVRDLQQQAWLRRLQQAADHELATIVVDDHAAMIRKWRDLLALVGIGDETLDREVPGFVGRYLVQLAVRPQTAPDVVHDLSTHREERDDALFDKALNAADRRGELDLFDGYATLDVALRRLMDWAGLTLPETDDGPLTNGHPR